MLEHIIETYKKMDLFCDKMEAYRSNQPINFQPEKKWATSAMKTAPYSTVAGFLAYCTRHPIRAWKAEEVYRTPEFKEYKDTLQT